MVSNIFIFHFHDYVAAHEKKNFDFTFNDYY